MQQEATKCSKQQQEGSCESIAEREQHIGPPRCRQMSNSSFAKRARPACCQAALHPTCWAAGTSPSVCTHRQLQNRPRLHLRGALVRFKHSMPTCRSLRPAWLLVENAGAGAACARLWALPRLMSEALYPAGSTCSTDWMMLCSSVWFRGRVRLASARMRLAISWTAEGPGAGGN